MDKTYNPHQIEQTWYKFWETSGYFSPSETGTPYCIMLPPPNVTGTLHMGHGFQVSLMDALIRYHRMRGFKTLWQAGTDHAGIATQMVVERLIAKNGQTRHELGRDAFVEKIWEWKDSSDTTIKQQLRRMGASLDWSREKFTMDDDINAAVREVFVKLHQENLIYRGQRLVNWDPVLLTAISDLEVNSQEEDGSLWYIRYPIKNKQTHLIIATTRPETLLGDTAVAVNPNDDRYKNFIGEYIDHPITGREIPIIADDFVDQEFGSGCVKITPAHDFNDYAMAQRHQLPMINIFTPKAQINDNAPSRYQGLDRFEARKKIVEELKELNLLENIQAHKLKVPRADRSGTVVEPYLTYQWFIKTKPLAQAALQAVANKEIEFVPENWTKTYFQWLENIEDWCISRQLWWGHRIPAWYDEQGNAYVAETEEAVRKTYNLNHDIKLRQDDDVLDTWFSASLWPFVTLGWPHKTAEFSSFYPTQVLVTGFDIIFFWVARMVMMGMKFTDKIPFQRVYVTGLIRDSEGQKMSKSKGNVLDPIDLIDGIDIDALIQKRTYGLMQPEMAKKIEQNTRKEFPEGIPAFGTDALRFTYCALATTGRDIRFDSGRIEGYRNFCNKLWNATRYVLMQSENQTILRDAPTLTELTTIDRWILSQLQQTITKVHENFTNYRFDLIAQTIYEFIWNEFCDWYLELTKPILWGDNEIAKNKTRHTLLNVLENILRLTHPLMPFITEEIWQKVAPLIHRSGPTIMLQPYPQFDELQINREADAEIEWLKQIILGVRNIRGEMNIAPSKPLTLLLTKGTEVDRQRMSSNKTFLTSLARLEKIEWYDDKALPVSTTVIVGQLELHIPLADLIDKSAEIKRLDKEISKLQSDLEKIDVKLNNPDYLAKAPTHIVEKEQTRAQEIKQNLEKLTQQQKHIEAI